MERPVDRSTLPAPCPVVTNFENFECNAVDFGEFGSLYLIGVPIVRALQTSALGGCFLNLPHEKRGCSKNGLVSKFIFRISNGTPIRATGTRVVAHDNPSVSWASGIAAALFATLFPSDCRLCSAPLINISRLPVCEECLGAMRPIAGGLCSVCGERLISPFAFAAEGQSSDRGEVLCGLCRRLEPPYVKATAYGSYDSGLRELIHLLKYNQVRPAANVLGRMLVEAMEDLQPLFSARNASYEPINVCAARRALVLVLKGVAMTEEENGHFLHAARVAMRVPSVIRLLEYRRIPHQSRALSRKNILLRDRNTCQYCATVLPSGELTLDHVIPRSRGGSSTWENLVACCHSCNRRKGNQFATEAGMKLMREPRAFNLHTSRYICG